MAGAVAWRSGAPGGKQRGQAVIVWQVGGLRSDKEGGRGMVFGQGGGDGVGVFGRAVRQTSGRHSARAARLRPARRAASLGMARVRAGPAGRAPEPGQQAEPPPPSTRPLRPHAASIPHPLPLFFQMYAAARGGHAGKRKEREAASPLPKRNTETEGLQIAPPCAGRGGGRQGARRKQGQHWGTVPDARPSMSKLSSHLHQGEKSAKRAPWGRRSPGRGRRC